MSPAADPRTAPAERILLDLGIVGGRVRVSGHQDEIAVVSVPDDAWERLLGAEGAILSERLRGLGFRYVGLDLAPGDAGG